VSLSSPWICIFCMYGECICTYVVCCTVSAHAGRWPQNKPSMPPTRTVVSGRLDASQRPRRRRRHRRPPSIHRPDGCATDRPTTRPGATYTVRTIWYTSPAEPGSVDGGTGRAQQAPKKQSIPELSPNYPRMRAVYSVVVCTYMLSWWCVGAGAGAAAAAAAEKRKGRAVYLARGSWRLDTAFPLRGAAHACFTCFACFARFLRALALFGAPARSQPETTY
jgi:hypothetical protein